MCWYLLDLSNVRQLAHGRIIIPSLFNKSGLKSALHSLYQFSRKINPIHNIRIMSNICWDFIQFKTSTALSSSIMLFSFHLSPNYEVLIIFNN